MVQRVIAIGASAGGHAALIKLLSELPEDFATPIVVAIHSGEDAELAKSLRQSVKGGPRIVEAENQTALEPGHVYTIPAAKHGLLKDGRIEISATVRDSGFRPSIDALFMTMAASYGSRGTAVVLSGTMDDGMRGAQVLHDLGGTTVVQDPDEAARPEMPRKVIRADHPHRVLKAAELGQWLLRRFGKAPDGTD